MRPVPYGGVKLAPAVLIKKRHTPPQTGLGGKERSRNVRQAFCVSRNSTVQGHRILLVDDVLTTGATADECARVLVAAGAASVDVLTLAKSVST